MKKITALFLSLIMVLGITACGNSNASVSSAQENSKTEDSQPAVPESTSAKTDSGDALEESQTGKTLVVYFSATGNTEQAAGYIADLTEGDLFELEPADPYTDEDLNYGNEKSRVSREYADESLRTVELLADTVENWESYDTVFIGYPIWWGIAAWPVDTFVKANDFTGKTVIPFCTSASSGLGESGELLAELAGTGDWQEGIRFRSSVSESDVQEWLDSVLNDKSEEIADALDSNTEISDTSVESETFSNEESSAPDTDVSESSEGNNILIAYFTMPEDVDTEGVDAIAGASIVVDEGKIMGNVEYIASIIQDTVGGDLFQIETVEQYPLDHDPLVDQAAQEQGEDARPELSTHIENLEQYDTIFLGYPNWWGDMPQALYAFLEEYDFSGKTIIPFCPHGGSGFSRTESTIAELQPGATVSENGLEISRNDVAGSRDQVVQWAAGFGL
ncbi:putative flavodoxin [Clostridium sp. CAG:242]|nr:flavodoxin [Negativibacillus massiliensis]CDA77398.1 putative flavodoxin [Clostridium sp. CAG:242]